MAYENGILGPSFTWNQMFRPSFIWRGTSRLSHIETVVKLPFPVETNERSPAASYRESAVDILGVIDVPCLRSRALMRSKIGAERPTAQGRPSPVKPKPASDSANPSPRPVRTRLPSHVPPSYAAVPANPWPPPGPGTGAARG
jgi:hypothetical protein